MGRGPAQFVFTLEDLAQAAGVPADEVRRAKRRKEFDPKRFDSVLRWALRQAVVARLGV